MAKGLSAHREIRDRGVLSGLVVRAVRHVLEHLARQPTHSTVNTS
jgi:hypothetical protein